MEFDFHKIVYTWADMTPEEFAELREGIRRDKYDPARPIYVLKGTGLIIDGRHRYLACRELGLFPQAEEKEFKDEDELERFVRSLNQHRRSNTVPMSKEQRDALILARHAEGKTQREIAEEVKVSAATVNAVVKGCSETEQPHPAPAAPSQTPVESGKSGESAGETPEISPVSARNAAVQALGSERAARLFAHFTSKPARGVLNKLAGADKKSNARKVLEELSRLVDGGVLGPPNDYHCSDNDKLAHTVNPRFIAKKFPFEFSRAHMARLTGKELGAFLEKLPRLVAAAKLLHGDLAGLEHQQQEIKLKQFMAYGTTQPAVLADATPRRTPLAQQEQEILWYGVPLWPLPEFLDEAERYDYESAQAWVHFLGEVDRAIAQTQPDVKSRGAVYRSLAGLFSKYGKKHEYRLLFTVGDAMHRNPDAEDKTLMPRFRHQTQK